MTGMKSVNWTLGIQRLYFVAWAVWFCASVAGGYEEGKDGDWLLTFFSITVIAGIILPAIIYFAGRWIYRGFVRGA